MKALGKALISIPNEDIYIEGNCNTLCTNICFIIQVTDGNKGDKANHDDFDKLYFKICLQLSVRGSLIDTETHEYAEPSFKILF